MMARLKELEEENHRLKKMYAKERLKAEIAQEAMVKSGEAITSKADGARRCQKKSPKKGSDINIGSDVADYGEH